MDFVQNKNGNNLHGPWKLNTLAIINQNIFAAKTINRYNVRGYAF